MRSLGYLAAALTLILVAASPAMAKLAMIETAAPIKDQSEDSVKAALKEAVDTAARGALAMGLPWVQVRDAKILHDAVAVQVLATDEAPPQGNSNNEQGVPGGQGDLGPGGSEHPSPPQHLQPGHPEPNQPPPSDRANL